MSDPADSDVRRSSDSSTWPRSCPFPRRSRGTSVPVIAVALEGFTHLIPFAAGHEIIRQGLADLTLIRMTPDLIYDQMIGCGCARKLVFSWGGNPGVGSLHRLRDAVERGWPRPLEIEEHSHSAMAHAYAAGAAGPALRDLSRLPGLAASRGEPAHQDADLSVHRGNAHGGAGAAARRRGDSRAESRSRRQCAGRRASSACRRKPCSRRGARLRRSRRSSTTSAPPGPTRSCCPSWTLSAVAVAPGGARPSYAHGYYARDNAFYTAWDAIARDRDRFTAWIDANVKHAAGAERA